MTDEELQRACAELYAQIDETARDIDCYEYGLPRYGKADQFMPMLLAFSRRMQAVGLREAENALRNDPDNLADWTDEARKVADKVADWCEAEAKKLEHV